MWFQSLGVRVPSATPLRYINRLFFAIGWKTAFFLPLFHFLLFPTWGRTVFFSIGVRDGPFFSLLSSFGVQDLRLILFTYFFFEEKSSWGQSGITRNHFLSCGIFVEEMCYLSIMTIDSITFYICKWPEKVAPIVTCGQDRTLGL